MRWQSCTCRPLSAYTVDDEVIGELGDGDGEVDLWFRLEFIRHADAVGAEEGKWGREGEVEPCGSGYDVDFMQLSG